MYLSKKAAGSLFTVMIMFLFLQLVIAGVCPSDGFIGRFQQNDNVTIVQTCPTCTFLNITITNPNSTIIFQNVPMDLTSNDFVFGPNDSISDTIGTYFILGTSNLDEPFKACYLVTNIPTEITTSESIVYIILTFFVFIMFVFCLWIGVGVSGSNERNELGRVIGINTMKYVKLGAIFLSYAFFTWLINILYTLSVNLVTLTQYQGFFLMMFNFLMAGLYVVFVFMIIIFFILAARDLKLESLLGRGIQPR